MAKVKDNVHVHDNIYLLSVEYNGICKMGQFFMLRCWELDPLLSRPISIFDYEDGELKFLYQVVGKGTEKLSRLVKGDEITLHGPYGNGFPYLEKCEITLAGGGIGIAPLFYAGRELNRINPNRKLNIFLGFREKSPLIDVFKEQFQNVIVDIGGVITDEIIYKKESVIYTCGPEVMMQKICEEGMNSGATVYASVEKRMACGVGACLGCTCKTVNGNKRTCKDGPVFLGDEIIYG
ncbi:dihydroorotate dehydrogenase electron transfer subunit [Alkalibaculum sp. M08DMB]|uniref:Dihydroorotate dehydrogenase electron transfer subunit n=1 Tax=Alkalibaculum sporogenes TaxID=2655001 RepID=A0A6A7KBH4_9FIRM|nr:dihydroorotate dehydrogenase electron transfer subunit [Alkalibaculum sporogenes]MPW26868.1 dihydroorotate dehydrogenase electron transfer subunit [Alkalibaculum sporogenes]